MGYTVVMHIEAVPNRGSHPTILLRQSYRDGKNVRKRTLANLTCLPEEAIETLKRTLRGEKLVPCDQAFAIERSIPHGHVKAILGTIRKIGLDTIIASRRSPERDLVVAMIAERLLHGRSKLASTRLWHTTTLAEELSVQDADVDELYEAMDWLLGRQERIEKKLASRHLGEGAHVFYDAKDTVRSYKNLAQVELGFRCLKGIDIRVRPIHHSTDPRVRAHVFLCFLAYYVEWHMRKAFGPLLFDDQELAADRRTREGHLCHVVPFPWRPAELADDLGEIHLLPQVTCQQHGPPRECLFAGHFVGKGEAFPAVFAEGSHQVVQLIAEQIQPPQAGDDPLLGASLVAVGFDDLDVVIFLVAALDLLGACEHKPAPPYLPRTANNMALPLRAVI